MSENSAKIDEIRPPRDESRIGELLPLLLKSRWAAWSYVAFALTIAIGSFGQFCYTVQLPPDRFGNLYRDLPGSWVLMCIQLVRAFIFGWLTIMALRYLRRLQRLQDGRDVQLEPLIKAISQGIEANGWCCLVMLVSILAFFIDIANGLPSIPLGFRPSRIELPDAEANAVKIEFHEARFTETNGWIESSFTMKKSVREPVFLNRDPILVTEDILAAKPTIDEQGSPSLMLRFTDEGSRKLAAATAHLIDKPVAIVIDDVVLTVPIVRSPLSGSILLTGDWTEKRVQEIADSINGAPRMKGEF